MSESGTCSHCCLLVLLVPMQFFNSFRGIPMEIRQATKVCEFIPLALRLCHGANRIRRHYSFRFQAREDCPIYLRKHPTIFTAGGMTRRKRDGLATSRLSSLWGQAPLLLCRHLARTKPFLFVQIRASQCPSPSPSCYPPVSSSSTADPAKAAPASIIPARFNGSCIPPQSKRLMPMLD